MNITQEDTMKRQTNLVALFATAGALLVGGVAHAQPPSGPPPGFVPPSGPTSGAPGGTTDAGAISNTTTTTTVTATDSAFVDDTATLPDTGGAPLLMALAGTMVAGGAFFLRRKLV
jgi:LPXTG-motif cell wall-anchored protein